jgi:hypothetical protein
MVIIKNLTTRANLKCTLYPIFRQKLEVSVIQNSLKINTSLQMIYEVLGLKVSYDGS